MSLQDNLFSFLSAISFWDLWMFLNPTQLTVLNYHRVCSPDAPEALFKPNISTTPEGFSDQLDYLQQHFNVISTKLLKECLEGQAVLPKRAALITFDDGYKDNYLNAFPELIRRGLPAIIFLTTGFIHYEKPFYWDQIAYSLQQTTCKSLRHPVFGDLLWEGASEIDRVTLQVVESLKKLPESQKLAAVTEILGTLGVKENPAVFSNLALTWGHIREMAGHGIEFGAHTENHPILTKIPLGVAQAEICGSKSLIEQEIGREVMAFAYPNGQKQDFNPEIQAILQEEGYSLGFALTPGPHRYWRLARERFAIRRVFLSYHDDLNRFKAKICGMPRLFELFGKGVG